MDFALPLDAALAFERARDDDHVEVAFPAVGGAMMALVPRAVVHHLQPVRLEGDRQLVADSLGHTSHLGAPSILECENLGVILHPMSRAFQYKPKFVDIRVRPPKEGEEEA